MTFSSPTFLFAFLPAFLLVYLAVRKRALRNYWLLAASLAFYAWGEPVYVLLMIASIVFNWGFALAIGDAKDGRGKGILALACVFNVAVIGFFKYEGFLADAVNSVIGAQIVPNLMLPLPIGISFFTLQALSYVIDVYRKEVPPQRNIAFLGMYVAAFPQLIAGPIVRYQTIQEQVEDRAETLEGVSSGIRLFVVGLAKKVLLADTMAMVAESMMGLGPESIGAVGAWAGLLAYTFQIYFDFSGYSDMAIGLGRIMGFRYLRNFNYPYIAQNVAEFWRRWHISLSTFFRDYLYIPLGGNRVSTARWVFNIAVVWATTGLWHGAAWNFVLWGLYYGLVLVLEKQLYGRLLARLPRVVRHVYTVVAFMFGWLLFWMPDTASIAGWLAAMFGAFGATGTSTLWELGVWAYAPVFLTCVAASLPLCPLVAEFFAAKAEGRPRRSIFDAGGTVHYKSLDSTVLFREPDGGKAGASTPYKLYVVMRDVAIAVLLLACVSTVVSTDFSPFIYFRF